MPRVPFECAAERAGATFDVVDFLPEAVVASAVLAVGGASSMALDAVDVTLGAAEGATAIVACELRAASRARALDHVPTLAVTTTTNAIAKSTALLLLRCTGSSCSAGVNVTAHADPHLEPTRS
ncbi:hypothetical protein AKJ09_00286 [Labilithrix luteola]|uniref:Uncharacterized protein n=1 Tax=Labilithrix luteola TaxID=1391654 RepID=A0A0K1PJC7_9BACT|nr:hypothetical protein AKJ09_00286 [Labilithrix luteola]